MYILGISCFFHDAAAALLRDGVLVAAAEEERFTRKKHDFEFPLQAIRYVLEAEGITAADLEYVAFFEKPFVKFERILMTSLRMFPRAMKVFREAMVTWLLDKLWVSALITEQLGVPREKILFSRHHLSHAASAFFCSPFDSAAILTVDGVGEWATATMGWAKGNELHLWITLHFITRHVSHTAENFFNCSATRAQRTTNSLRQTRDGHRISVRRPLIMTPRRDVTSIMRIPPPASRQ